MCFGGALQRIIKQVLTSDPCIRLVYLSKVDLADAYMRLWVKMEDVSSVAFLTPRKTPATHSWQDSNSPSPWGTYIIPPTFSWQWRWWPTSQTKTYPRWSRQSITCWKCQASTERQMTKAHRMPKLTPSGNTSQRSSAPPPGPTSMST